MPATDHSLFVAIFSGTEIIFQVLFVSSCAKHAGTAIGLTIGYIIQYFPVKKYMFIEKQAVIL